MVFNQPTHEKERLRETVEIGIFTEIPRLVNLMRDNELIFLCTAWTRPRNRNVRHRFNLRFLPKRLLTLASYLLCTAVDSEMLWTWSSWTTKVHFTAVTFIRHRWIFSNLKHKSHDLIFSLSLCPTFFILPPSEMSSLYLSCGRQKQTLLVIHNGWKSWVELLIPRSRREWKFSSIDFTTAKISRAQCFMFWLESVLSLVH